MKYGDTGTPELLNHRGIKITIVDGQPRARINTVSPVHTMYERGVLNIGQFSAAKEFYRHWVTGWGMSNDYSIKERVDGGAKNRELTTKQIHSMREFERGKKAMIKLGTWDVMNKVVIDEIAATKKGMGCTERKKIMFWLRKGLDDLARVYGVCRP